MTSHDDALHRDALVVDAHNDLLMSVAARDPADWGSFFESVWLPQLEAAAVDVQVLPVFIDEQFQPELALRQTIRMITAARTIAQHCADRVTLCETAAQMDATTRAGRIALVLALEGCPAIGSNVEILQTLYALGVRIAALTHYGRNALADGSGEDATGSRLTRAGVAAIAEMERLGALVDVSHLGASGVEHVLELATRPVIATHSCARALRDHHRNLTDDQIKAIAATGGVICLNFYAGFVAEHDPTMDRLVDHVEHLIAVAGPDHVGIGPDFVHQVFSELCLAGARTSCGKGWT